MQPLAEDTLLFESRHLLDALQEERMWSQAALARSLSWSPVQYHRLRALKSRAIVSSVLERFRRLHLPPEEHAALLHALICDLIRTHAGPDWWEPEDNQARCGVTPGALLDRAEGLVPNGRAPLEALCRELVLVLDHPDADDRHRAIAAVQMLLWHQNHELMEGLVERVYAAELRLGRLDDYWRWSAAFSRAHLLVKLDRPHEGIRLFDDALRSSYDQLEPFQRGYALLFKADAQVLVGDPPPRWSARRRRILIDELDDAQEQFEAWCASRPGSDLRRYQIHAMGLQGFLQACGELDVRGGASPGALTLHEAIQQSRQRDSPELREPRAILLTLRARLRRLAAGTRGLPATLRPFTPEGDLSEATHLCRRSSLGYALKHVYHAQALLKEAPPS